jgi:uncharacterized protein YjbI with pentapeptide repeats
MACPEHIEILKQGVDKWNAWRRNATGRIDLSGADLRGADLMNFDLGVLKRMFREGSHAVEQRLARVDLSGADLSNAKLVNARLDEALLVSANMRASSLFEASLRLTNLREADVAEASLAFARLENTNCEYTKVHKAILRGTVFVNTYLSKAEGLENFFTTDLARLIYGPSEIVRIYRSHSCEGAVYQKQ